MKNQKNQIKKLPFVIAKNLEIFFINLINFLVPDYIFYFTILLHSQKGFLPINKNSIRLIKYSKTRKSEQYMQKVKFSNEFLTRNSTPRSSTIVSQRLSRSERNTHQSKECPSIQINNEFLSDVSSPLNKDFITEKSKILMRLDNNIEQKIQRRITLQKMNAKMSILSMQKTKFKFNRTKSSFKLNTRFNSVNLTIDIKNRKSGSQLLSRVESIQKKDDNFLCVSQAGEFRAFRQYLKVVLLNHPKLQNDRKVELFTRNMINFFIQVEGNELIKSLNEIKLIQNELMGMLTDNNHELDLGAVRIVERDISKLLLDMCCEIYFKKKKKIDYDELIRLNKDIEYTSRRLKFFKLAILTLLDLGQLYCDQMEYQKAFQEYTHAVKLAIFTNNKYYQEVAIDKLGICKYYMGDSVSALYFHNNLDHISHYDLNRVKTEYSNDKEIQRLLQQKNQIKPPKNFIHYKNRKRISKHGNYGDQQNLISQSYSQKIEIGEFTFQKQNRNEFYPILNNMQMKSNLKKLVKMPELRQKVFILKKNLKKNDSLGTKKYCGETYVIPSATNCIRKENNFEMNEVCLSHKSFNRHDTVAYGQKLDRDSKILVTVLNYFVNQNFIGN